MMRLTGTNRDRRYQGLVDENKELMDENASMYSRLRKLREFTASIKDGEDPVVTRSWLVRKLTEISDGPQ